MNKKIRKYITLGLASISFMSITPVLVVSCWGGASAIIGSTSTMHATEKTMSFLDKEISDAVLKSKTVEELNSEINKTINFVNYTLFSNNISSIKFIDTKDDFAFKYYYVEVNMHKSITMDEILKEGSQYYLSLDGKRLYREKPLRSGIIYPIKIQNKILADLDEFLKMHISNIMSGLDIHQWQWDAVKLIKQDEKFQSISKYIDNIYSYDESANGFVYLKVKIYFSKKPIISENPWFVEGEYSGYVWTLQSKNLYRTQIQT